MGVTGLWTVLQPCARPTKLETLNKKRLAVDASIWIYQFLKAVRDKEGVALRNSHVVGFFRRICKLLFFGIKPVFVFDGGAPALKRQTIANRKRRREGRREDAVRTASKLLSVQMQRRAEEERQRQRQKQEKESEKEKEREASQDNEEPVPENLVYVEELQMNQQEREQLRHFKKTDAYHLPELKVSLAEMGAPNDPRIMSHEELEEYSKQFHSGQDINLYDFSKIDFTSPYFLSLPASDRYNILNAARLRSRLRMGYSKDQLDDMFPDRMDFSKFQIDRVAKRNELTQRLMNINGMNGDDSMIGANGASRIAGEKGREYVLVKNDGVEGGWALGVVGNKEEGERNQPIDVEAISDRKKRDENSDQSDGDEAFEDVPIQGLNRLYGESVKTSSAIVPQIALDLPSTPESNFHDPQLKGMDFRRRGADRASNADNNELFFPYSQETQRSVQAAEERINDDYDAAAAADDEDLKKAIAMSLETPDSHDLGELDMLMLERSHPFLPNSSVESGGPSPTKDFQNSLASTDKDDEDMDLQTALRRSKKAAERPQSVTETLNTPLTTPFAEITTNKFYSKRLPGPEKGAFDGPLPFERLEFGKSTLTKKKKTTAQEDPNAGGFQRSPEIDGTANIEAIPNPIPPWFSGSVLPEPMALESHPTESLETAVPRDLPSLRRTKEIDVDDPETQSLQEVNKTATNGVDKEDLSVNELSAMDRVQAKGHLKVTSRPPLPKEDTYKDLDNGNSSGNEEAEWSESDQGDLSHTLARVSARKTPDIGPNSDSYTPISERISSNNESTKSSPNAQMSGEPHRLYLVDEEVEEDMYSNPEDEELINQLAIEEEEHERFALSLNSKAQPQNPEDYERELRALQNQQKKDRRDADEVTQSMIAECQQLLRLFGLPYITAPMEAEAQCAELVRLGLVDGIVTDDSDVFLFGGTRVYKNMFNQAKYVECYLSSDLEKEFDLTRDKLVRIAHLLGSDYTEGLPSVGPVTALEILAEFNTERSLEDFRDWWVEIQSGSRPIAADAKSPFRKKFRKNAMKLFLPTSFPDIRVSQAYMEPEVDHDTAPFVWGVPDLSALRSFLMSTIGWSQERTDEVLVPVIRDMNRREREGTQANITSFFEGPVGLGGLSAAYAPRRRGEEGGSKRVGRMETALGKLSDAAKRKRAGPIAEDTASNPEVIDPDERPRKKKARQKPIHRTKKVSKKGDKVAVPSLPIDISSLTTSDNEASDEPVANKSRPNLKLPHSNNPDRR
ncbi:MAG: DNA repair protein rad2 [Trizodia sp. TS-e1964]|nr:MAG: DNA repair protein rad2 [Trizodia sp. TS-e1964]